ncbi:MAG: DUF4180 domain-containing protein [Lachnospiraceae bacterium]|jgi:hypothetical protein|nr:DUF4180 domain-containing protein [Lachnospiraceae bacterium]
MNIKSVVCGNKTIAIVTGEHVMYDVQSALDLMMTVKYEANTNLIAIDKRGIIEDFFILSKGLAGEILQKMVNYHVKMAIYGDFSKYTSKPLKDFMYESNHGKDIFFVETAEEAIRRFAE